MVWTQDHEVMLCREIILNNLYQHRDGSRERGQCLDRIAESLNDVTTIWFKVDQRALRDKIKNLLQLYVAKKNKEERASGIDPEHTELDDLLEEIYERKKESEINHNQQSAEKTKKIEEEKEAAEDIRQRSVERLSETRKREAHNNPAGCSSSNDEKKRRSSGGDTIAYLREKSEKDFQLRESELELRRKELELNKAREGLLVQQSQAMMMLINKLADKF